MDDSEAAADVIAPAVGVGALEHHVIGPELPIFRALWDVQACRLNCQADWAAGTQTLLCVHLFNLLYLWCLVGLGLLVGWLRD